MPSYTVKYYASHYAPIQHAKYAQLWPQIKPFFDSNKPLTLLDVGIGPAWLEGFLAEKNVSFSRVVGVDISEEAIAPRKEGIEYVLTPNFNSDEKFDVVICFDAWHCFPQMDLKKFVKPNGLFIVSEPLAFETQLEKLSEKRPVDAVVGEMEKSRIVLVKI